MNPFRLLDPNLPERTARSVCALAVMTKAPQAGRVKTRLIPPLTPEEAAELNRCFLRDTTAAISVACSRRPMGDASKMQSEHACASHSEAATAARGIAVYTPSVPRRRTTVFCRPISVCCRNVATNSVSVSISRSRICSNAVSIRCVSLIPIVQLCPSETLLKQLNC